MSSIMILYIVALAFLIVSFVWGVLYPDQLKAPLVWAVWAIAIVIVFSGLLGVVK